MQTVDLVIAGVGVMAILATTLGLVFYEEAAGIDEVTFDEVAGPTFSEEATQAPGEQTYTFAIPANATQARADITLDVQRTNQGVGPYSGSFSAYIVGPNGTQSDVFTDTYSFGNQANTAQATVSIPFHRFFDVPAAQNVTGGSVDASKDWNQPLSIVVTINDAQPSSPGNLNPIPSTFAFTATIAGEFQVFREAPQVISDPQAV